MIIQPTAAITTQQIAITGAEGISQFARTLNPSAARSARLRLRAETERGSAGYESGT